MLYVGKAVVSEIVGDFNYSYAAQEKTDSLKTVHERQWL